MGDSVGLFREDKMSTWLGNAGGGTGKSYVIIHFMGMDDKVIRRYEPQDTLCFGWWSDE